MASKKKEAIECLAAAFLIISSGLFAFHYSPSESPERQLSTYPMITTSNAAYMNSTTSYYTNLGKGNSGTLRFNASFDSHYNYYSQSWYFNNEPIGNSSQTSASDVFSVGDYQYWGDSPIGNGVYYYNGGSYSGSFRLGFQAGVDSNGHANVGTIYSNLLIYDIANGTLMSNVTWTDSLNETFSGNSVVITVNPNWTPILKSGYYDFKLKVSASAYTNYIGGNPYDLFCTLPGGNSPMTAYPILGWTYSGLTEGFPIDLPSNTSAFQFTYNSSEPIQVNIGGTTSSQETQNKLNFYSNAYKSGQFQNVFGDPNVTNVTVQYQVTNVIITKSNSNPTLTASTTIIQNQNWYNLTYPFVLNTPNGALNGLELDGRQWNTSWNFVISHVMDSAFNTSSPINYFYVNDTLISNPKEYNTFSGMLVDSTNSSSIYLNYHTGEFVNYYPSLVSSYESNQTVYSTQPITFIVNSSEKISGEPDRVSIQWGDGSYFTSNISSSYIFVVNHTYLVPGNYTPKVTITNFPNSQGMSLSTGELSLGTIYVRQIPISVSTSRTVVNPLMPVNFVINTTTNVFPNSDTISVNFGDNHTLNHSFVRTLSINASYSKTGIYSPFVQVISSGRVLTEVYASRITIAPIILQTNNVEVDNIEHLRLNYSSLSKVKNISLQINGNLTENFKIGNSNGTLYYNYTYIKRMINGTMYGNFELWVATTNYGYSQNTSNYFTPPVITNFSSTSNPSRVGWFNSFNFEIYYVNYDNINNNTKIFVDGKIIALQNGYYYFNQTGKYNVTLVATNSYGNATYSYIQTVLPNNPIILSANASAEKVTTGTLVSFYANINWQGQVGNVTWSVNSNKLDGNSYNFTYPGNYSVSVLATNNQGSWGYSFNEVVVQMPSKINSISILPSVIHTGDIVTFSASVSWYKTNGSLIWQINGTNVTGDSHIFSVHGNYTLTVIAKNSYGSTSKSIEITVEQTPASANLEIELVVVFTVSGLIASGGLLYWRKHR